MKPIIILTLIIFLFPSSYLSAQNTFDAVSGVQDTIYIMDGFAYDMFGVKEVKPEKVETTSTLAHKSDRYKKENLMDGDEKTAWVEGKDGDGINEKITFTFTNDEKPELISIIPGYNSSEETWDKNNRVLKVKITLLTSADSPEPQETVDEFYMNFPLDKNDRVSPGEYSIEFSSIYLHNMIADELSIIVFEIIEVDKKDSKYEDTCVSEIRFFVSDDTKNYGKISREEYAKKFYGE